MKAMKNRTLRFFCLLIVEAVLMLGVSCSNDPEYVVEQPVGTDKVEHTSVMHLSGGLQSYAQTRATSTEWNDGDIIYLRFYQADQTTVVCGKAVYNASTSLWNISYYGNLSTGTTLKCEAYYFVNATATDNYHVTMTPMSCAYVDEGATYVVENGELFVSASLAPKTARMRIQGETDKKIVVSGVVYSTSFDLTSKTFTMDEEVISTQFDTLGYTPYIYCSLDESQTIVLDDYSYKYTKTFDPAKFVAGKSGYIVMPTQVENKGWTSTFYYPENAVDLGLSVRWSSINVGASDQYSSGTYCSWGDAWGTNTSNSSYYNDEVHEIAGNPDYDIATRLWNDRWQIPTKEQWQELIDQCTWTYAYDSEKGVYGYTVTAENGNSIYLPMYNSASGSSLPSSSSSYGYYWSSTEYTGSDMKGYHLKLSSGSHNMSYEYKYYRMQIRPVLVK